MSKLLLALSPFIVLAGVPTNALAGATPYDAQFSPSPFDEFLPPGFRLSSKITLGSATGPKTTVGRELTRLGARIVDGRLQDFYGKPIYFFRFSDWDPQAQQGFRQDRIMRREQRNYEYLKETGTVIVLHYAGEMQ
jgi:hypothetical protein